MRYTRSAAVLLCTAVSACVSAGDIARIVTPVLLGATATPFGGTSPVPSVFGSPASPLGKTPSPLLSALPSASGSPSATPFALASGVMPTVTPSSTGSSPTPSPTPTPTPTSTPIPLWETVAPGVRLLHDYSAGIFTDWFQRRTPCGSNDRCELRPQPLGMLWRPTADGKREPWIHFQYLAPSPRTFSLSSLPGFVAFDPTRAGTDSFSFRGCTIRIDFEKDSYDPLSTRPFSIELFNPKKLGDISSRVWSSPRPANWTTTNRGLFSVEFDAAARKFIVQQNVEDAWVSVQSIAASELTGLFFLPDDFRRPSDAPEYHQPAQPFADWDPLNERLYVSARKVGDYSSYSVLIWSKSDRVWRVAKYPISVDYSVNLPYILVDAAHSLFYTITNLTIVEHTVSSLRWVDKGDFYAIDLPLIDDAALPIF